MMYPLFGNKNVKTAEELRNVGRRSLKSAPVASWSLDEVDALRVPILSGPHLVYSSNSKARWNALEIKQIGIYSPSQRFCEQAAAVISGQRLAVQCFGYAADNQQASFQALNSIDIWLVNVLDEDESPLLERIMNACSNVASLFLFDSMLSKQCVRKLEDFIQETGVAN
jgi:hypothetical protein